MCQVRPSGVRTSEASASLSGLSPLARISLRYPCSGAALARAASPPWKGPVPTLHPQMRSIWVPSGLGELSPARLFSRVRSTFASPLAPFFSPSRSSSPPPLSSPLHPSTLAFSSASLHLHHSFIALTRHHHLHSSFPPSPSLRSASSHSFAVLFPPPLTALPSVLLSCFAL